RFLPSEPFVKPGSRSSDLLGPRAPRPQTRRQARSLLHSSIFSRLALIAGGAPAVPNNHLTETRRGLLDEDRRHTPAERSARARLRVACGSGSSTALYPRLRASGENGSGHL